MVMGELCGELGACRTLIRWLNAPAKADLWQISVPLPRVAGERNLARGDDLVTVVS
jgi:hypothetical protein